VKDIPTYEYLVKVWGALGYNAPTLQDTLNELGAQGWRLIGSDDRSLHAIFIKPTTESAQEYPFYAAGYADPRDGFTTFGMFAGPSTDLDEVRAACPMSDTRLAFIFRFDSPSSQTPIECWADDSGKWEAYTPPRNKPKRKR
jgi:hypothetical protein